MGKRVTPVQAAKELGIRPQMVYGFIKHHRVATFPNPDGKADLVDFSEVQQVAKGVKPHRPTGSDGKPVKRIPAGVARGSIISYHGRASWRAPEKQRRHFVSVVDGVVPNDEGQIGSFSSLHGDGRSGIFWEAEHLADRIAKGECTIEPPESLFAVLEYHYMQENPEMAGKLREFIQAQGLLVPDLNQPAASTGT